PGQVGPAYPHAQAKRGSYWGILLLLSITPDGLRLRSNLFMAKLSHSGATMRRTLFAALLLCWGPLGHADDLVVSAAASLTNAFREIAGAFEQAHPEHQVQLNFAGSGVLLQQIARGAPVDIF